MTEILSIRSFVVNSNIFFFDIFIIEGFKGVSTYKYARNKIFFESKFSKIKKK